jgi:hypothetical protein
MMNLMREERRHPTETLYYLSLSKYIIHPCYNARIPFILESKRETFS